MRRFAIISVFIGTGFPATAFSQLPEHFYDELVIADWDQALGMVFGPDSRLYVWEKAGKVWIVENDVKSADPLLDISEEVGNWGDYGFLGFALDPGFESNGYIYGLYVVDYHHLAYYGTPDYSKYSNEYNRDTIGRLTRYTCNINEDGHPTVDYDSRLVLIGESMSTGFPICHRSHGVGTVLFGEDGTLLAGCGDAASYNEIDVGGPTNGSSNTALADGIIAAKEDVGAYRAQLIDSLDGKIVRIDPATGDGVPGNPFYDPAAPRAARSRVWALGLRNPFRFTLRPGSGQADPEAADPGTLYLGDVGYNNWEELDLCTVGGLNFGWPAFEGMFEMFAYYNSDVANLDAPNPLFGLPDCDQEFLYFRDLIIQDTLAPDPAFPNPCDPSQDVPVEPGRFIHARPVIDWGVYGPSRTAVYVGDQAAAVNLDDPASPVPGPNFWGETSIGGVWYLTQDFPPPYQNVYFHADFVAGWIKAFAFDPDDRPLEVLDFAPDGYAAIVALASDPVKGGLYYLDYDAYGTSSLRRMVYIDNFPPTAVATADVSYGPAPLTVQFTGSASSDPEGLPISYEWDFGDGSALSAEADPVHTYDGPEIILYDVTMKVTDAAGLISTAVLFVSLNNTPPMVTVTSPVDGWLYPLSSDTTLPLEADIVDAEHGPEELSCTWQTVLHHADHTHPEPVVPACVSEALISPVGCDGDTYYYETTITVTDPHGLSTTESAFVYPDCSTLPCEGDANRDGAVDPLDAGFVQARFGCAVSDSPECFRADESSDGVVDPIDVGFVLARLGACQ